MRTVSLAVLAAVAVASGASAQTPVRVVPAGASAFALCDGYGSPTKNGDGMTEPAWSWGGLGAPQGGAGDTTRRMPRLGETGVRMCDAALA
ncbi:hypothetical protein, partial [Caulobacter sp. 17J65-9]|uniref:hypothetical protein n=1 Tax=Caulobacter sp. 17J65-9 TaxID=2709382 RepID=UPI0013C9D11B